MKNLCNNKERLSFFRFCSNRFYQIFRSPGGAEFIALTMPTAGPNEYGATLQYSFAQDGVGHQELRIDAVTDSVPDRTAAERVASAGPVVITGYGKASLFGSDESVTVTVTGGRAERLRMLFDQLGLGNPPECMEFEQLYEIEFLGTTPTASRFTATGSLCGGDVIGVDSNHRYLVSLADPHCSLLAAVAAMLPARPARATREAVHLCRSI